ncbi:UNVERIFIED_CONTAM: Gag-Pol polyprotein [Sesamum radiatum]|uniref:Gag-Pol polyprotein n=1 Tax=Sesamum radiatum TaxID=300843 RepID=A0AAW2L0Y3_SESRA
MHVVPKEIGYYQITIAQEDQEKTTFTCPFSTFAFRRMPFCLCNAPEAFDELKQALTSAPIIQPPDWSISFEIMCDASNYAVGAVLGQRIEKTHHVIYYASKTLDAAQCNYSNTEKELLAIVFPLDKFRSYLFGSKIVVFSDHAALKHLQSK